MCSQQGSIRIPGYIHEQFPDEVKAAWETFHEWWEAQEEEHPKRSDMPQEVAQAYEIIKKAQIPGQPEGTTCEQSCYVIGVEKMLID
jgi:hypothetical protein